MLLPRFYHLTHFEFTDFFETAPFLGLKQIFPIYSVSSQGESNSKGSSGETCGTTIDYFIRAQAGLHCLTNDQFYWKFVLRPTEIYMWQENKDPFNQIPYKLTIK